MCSSILSPFTVLNLFNSPAWNQTFSSSEIPTWFQTVLRFSWVCFMVHVIGSFNRVHWCFISSTSGARMMYFFPSAIYPPVIPFKKGPTKLPRTGASKGTKKAPPSCTKISFLFFCNVSGFTSSRILSWFLLIYFFSWSLTLIFLLMILMVHSQITLVVSGFKCFNNSSFCALEEQCNTINIGRFFLMFLDMLTVE